MEPTRYINKTDALDDFDRALDIAFFLVDARCDMAICAERECLPPATAWQGLYVIMDELANRLDAIRKMCWRRGDE